MATGREETAPRVTVSGAAGYFEGGPLRPLVDLVAGIKVSVHTKLLTGFLLGALLLLGMALLSMLIIGRMSERVEEVTALHEKQDRARQMEYLITAQSHFRAMALLTQDDSNNDKIINAKRDFLEHLNAIESVSRAEQNEFFRRMGEANRRFEAYSAKALELYKAGNQDEAMKVHLFQEHPVSHELEAAIRELERDSGKEMGDSIAAFRADQGLLTAIVGIFSIIGLGSALLLGFALSWAFIRPLHRINTALAGIASGDFTQLVEVPNKDEFGTLSKNVNSMSQHLAALYQELQSLNENLQQKVEEQVQQLERTAELRRYLSPQIAESILTGGTAVSLTSRRKSLTIFFSDIRGFTPLSEQLEPEELVDMLNQYLEEMTKIVFKHGGTLDKYIGDSIMVFFGDPIPYEDHAARAVSMALEMRVKLAELQPGWFLEKEAKLAIGMGISTGYVTVGNIGSSTRLEYTVLGNNVNLASRLADRALPGQILISERTLLAVQHLVAAEEIGQVELEGVSRPIRVFEINEKARVVAESQVPPSLV